MSEAFLYMFVVGLGCSLGVATTVLISYLTFKRMNKEKKVKKRGMNF